MKQIPRDQYSCTCCGTCCRWNGYVRMTEKEVDDIAEFLKMPVHEFIDKYTIVTSDRRNLSLIEDEKNGYCIFLDDEGKCIINEVKPQQCRDFPYKWRFFGWRKTCEMKKNY